MSSTLKNILPKDIDPFLEDNTPIIDIRTDTEWNSTGMIKGSYKLTFFDNQGNYNLEDWLEKFQQIVKNKDDKFVLVCAHAHRTQNVGDYLAQKLEYTNAYHLQGGIALWLADQRDVEK